MERKSWPYVAGTLDSEGTITIFKRTETLADGLPRTELDVSVRNTDIRLVRWLVANFGGVFYTYANGGNMPGKQRRIHWWKVPLSKQDWFLREISEYLVLKREQAALALQYVEAKRSEDRQKCLDIAEECGRLNSRSPDDLPFDQSLSDQDISTYAAAYLDGDGTICIPVCRPRESTMLIFTSAFRMVRWFMKNFGGRFQTYVIPGRRVKYHWKLSGARNKEQFLIRLLPYLILKREQAKLMLEGIRMNGRRDPEYRKLLALKCSALNHPIEESVTTETKESGFPDMTQSDLAGDRESEQAGTPVS